MAHHVQILQETEVVSINSHLSLINLGVVFAFLQFCTATELRRVW